MSEVEKPPSKKSDEKNSSLTPKKNSPPKKLLERQRKFRGVTPRWLVHLNECRKRARKIVYDSSSEEENIPSHPSNQIRTTDSAKENNYAEPSKKRRKEIF